MTDSGRVVRPVLAAAKKIAVKDFLLATRRALV
jgi:hypothetical protein